MRLIVRRYRYSPSALALAAVLLLVIQAGCVNRRMAGIRPTAALPCPPWVEFPASHYSNRDSIYLGCTNALNLERMLERPNDLILGRSLGPASGERESKAVERYNQGKVTSLIGAGAAAPAVVMPASGGSTP